MSEFESLSLEFHNLREIYLRNPRNLLQVLQFIKKQMGERDESGIWISRLSWDQIFTNAERLLGKVTGLSGIGTFPLFGIPFAVKDNIDVTGMFTTVGCPDFSYSAKATAFSVTQLLNAGAILIGKTNMDQFATGLVGVRSPYGPVLNPFNPDFISGGSSSGSAVAVAVGWVSFALGTDTAGSGRVPAGFNNVVGLKPTRGLIGTSGVFPACRSLDCVSVFALTCDNAYEVLTTLQGVDSADPLALKNTTRLEPLSYKDAGLDFSSSFTFGIPESKFLEFFGDEESEKFFRESCDDLERMDGKKIEIPFEAFVEAASLLYHGPWLAERQVAFGSFLDENPNAVLPVIRSIMVRSKTITAAETFRAFYKLKELCLITEHILKDLDMLVVPTSATIYTRAQIEDDPIRLNTHLGYYTNFANLLNLSALSIPSKMRQSGPGFGITLLAPALKEGLLTQVGRVYHNRTGLKLGATPHQISDKIRSTPSGIKLPVTSTVTATASHSVRLAVVGLHLTGQPLNGQLTDLDAKCVGNFHTAPVYRFYAIDKGAIKIPGLVKQESGGQAIEVEVWELTYAALGEFMLKVNSPLCIGTLDLNNGEQVKGFLSESWAVKNADDITHFGGWRAYKKIQAEGK